MPDGRAWPTISIVVPSYQQGQFIEETLRSVLLQGYPAVELIVIDGGSQDQTVALLSKYSAWISYSVSEHDNGQSHAINKGFRRATGDLIGWQNSDDVYYAGAFRRAAETMMALPGVDIVYGQTQMINADGQFLASGTDSSFAPEKMVPWINMHNQAMFLRRRVLQAGHFIDESFHHCMDVDFFWRLILSQYSFQFIPELFAGLREHAAAKGSRQYVVAANEYRRVYAALARDSSVPAHIRQQAIQSLIMWAHANFAKDHIELFREDVATIWGLNKAAALKLSLLAKLVLSLGPKRVLRLYHRFMDRG